jgi:hypothetical protein
VSHAWQTNPTIKGNLFQKYTYHMYNYTQRSFFRSLRGDLVTYLAILETFVSYITFIIFQTLISSYFVEKNK